MLKCSYSDLCACLSNTVGVLLAGSLCRFIISRYVWYSCNFKSGGEQQSQNKNNVAVSPSNVSIRLFSSSHLRLSVPAAGQLNLKGGCSRVKRFPFFSFAESIWDTTWKHPKLTSLHLYDLGLMHQGKPVYINNAWADRSFVGHTICWFLLCSYTVAPSVFLLNFCLLFRMKPLISPSAYFYKYCHILLYFVSRVSPQDDFLFSVSIVSGLTCAVLAVAKFMLGRVLTSRALITDGRTHTHTHAHAQTLMTINKWRTQQKSTRDQITR